MTWVANDVEVMQSGELRVPMRPGLGMEVREELLTRYRA